MKPHQATSDDQTDWRRGRLKNMVSQVRNGVWGDDPRDDGSDVACVRAADFDRQRLRVKAEGIPLRQVERRALKSQQLLYGDVILEKSGGGERQPVGAAVIFDLDIEAVCSNFCARLRPTNGVEPRFLNYSLAAAYYLGLSQRSIKQTTGIQNLDAGEFFSTPWSYPALREQQRIADFLDAETAQIDDICRLRELQVAVLDTRMDSLLAEMTSLSDDPTVRVKRVVSKITSGPRGWGDYVRDQGSLFIRIANISALGIDLDLTECAYVEVPDGAERRRTVTRAGDVLMSITADIGSVAVLDESAAGANVSQHVALLRPIQGASRPRWLAYALRSARVRQNLLMESYGGTKVGLGLSDIANLQIPTPELAEQQRRSDLLDDVWSADRLAKQALHSQVKLLAERRQALITAAVTGQFDVTTARGADLS